MTGMTGAGAGQGAWTDVGPGAHLVQIYEDEATLMDRLEQYVAAGLQAREAVVLIATPAHLDELEARLDRRGVDVDAAARAGRYFTLDAEDTLSHLLVDGWPDEEHFTVLLTEILRQAGAGVRRVRAFGEMVALLCARGQSDAALRLEQLWHRLCHERAFALFCAYPQSVFPPGDTAALEAVRAVHSHVVE